MLCTGVRLSVFHDKHPLFVSVCIFCGLSLQVRQGMSVDVFPMASTCRDGKGMARWGQVRLSLNMPDDEYQ